MSSFFNVGTEERVSEVLFSSGGLVIVQGGLLLKVDSRPVRAGEQMAIDSGTNLAFPRKSTQLNGEHLTGVTTLLVDDAHNFEIGDVIAAGAQTAKTITDINYTTNVITIHTTLGGTVADDAEVRVTQTTQDTAVGIALVAMIDRYDTTKANRFGVVPFGPVAVRGTFVKTAIQDFNSESQTDFGGADVLNGGYAIK